MQFAVIAAIGGGLPARCPTLEILPIIGWHNCIGRFDWL